MFAQASAQKTFRQSKEEANKGRGKGASIIEPGLDQKSLGTKSFRSRRQVCHSWSVPGDS
jgi:hypothetical protein